jgi:hypothetical protein
MPNIGRKTKENETKREKFVRLAESRVENALRNINLIGNLANKSNYEYTQDDVDKILKALRSAVSNLEKTFSSSKSSRNKFKL